MVSNGFPISSISTYRYNSDKKTVTHIHEFFESFEQKAGGNRTWTYVNKPKEYRVTSNDNQVVINFSINGKKREITLVSENALKIQNLLKEINLPVKPIRPIKPVMPIKPIAPILVSFNDPEENQKEIDRYFIEIDSYANECKKQAANFQSELARYKEEAASYALNATKHEVIRKDLINLVESFIPLRGH